MSDIRILAINPGSTSTKFAVYFGSECRFKMNLSHSVEQLSYYNNIIDQFDFRKGVIMDMLLKENVELDKIKYIVGRGGFTYPLKSGVYNINNKMLAHLRAGICGQHASNLGPLIADFFAYHIPGAHAYIADPVVTDEMDDIAKVSGYPGFERRSIFHALNQKAIARHHAGIIDRNYEELNLIVAHLGGGISVGAHKKGKVIDVINAFDGEGPFSPERSGSLPLRQMIEHCFSNKYHKEEIQRIVNGEGGYVAYLGTNDAREVAVRAKKGDEMAIKIQNALGYQICKAIGEMSVVLDGNIDAILLTGGLAYNYELVQYIIKKVQFIAEVHVYPGEDELKSLALNVLPIALGEIEPLDYPY